MNFTDLVTGLAEKIGGDAPGLSEAASATLDKAAPADSSTLTSAITSTMQASETPAFSQITGHLFGNGDASQKAAMLNALLGGGAPGVLSKLSGLIPGFSANSPVTAEQAQAISPEAVTQIAAHAEQHDPSILEEMSSLYAAHPTIVKTLGTGAMMVALREFGKRTESSSS